MKTRLDAVRSIRDLRDNFASFPDEWENLTLGDYLDSMAAWLEASPALEEMEGTPWDLLCRALEVAKIYE